MAQKDIKFLRVTYLRGPNLWTYRPVIEAWVDIGELEDFPSNKIPGFYERLVAWLPSLVEHRCGVGERGGFLQRLREGTWPAHIMEHVAIELQNLAGIQAGFGKARETSQRGIYKVAVRARNEQIGRAAIQAARDLVMAAIEDGSYDVSGKVAELRDMVDAHHLGPSTGCIVDAANERGIPSIRLTDGNLVQLGYGARQRRIWTAETDRTSAIAEGISSDKDLTKTLLASCGVPVPEGQVAADPAEAWEAAQDIGLPVVVKPSDANHGRGVSLDLTTEQQVAAAWTLADKEGSEVIVERFVRGNEHRLLVVGTQVVAAARGEAAWIEGDGVQTVEALIESQINTDPRRGVTEDFPLNRLVLDEDPALVLELTRQGVARDSVPAKGVRVLVQRNGNVAIDCTDEVHPEVAAQVSLAARIVGLDIAGVDLVTEDISRPLEETGGAIVEVNAGPGLLMHLKPASGEGRPVGKAIAAHLFPDGDKGRIPVVGVTGSRETALLARLVTWLVHLAGKPVGLACSEGLFLDRRQVERGDRAHWQAGQQLLMNRRIEAAVFENSAKMMLEEGLAYDRCAVGIVTDVHLGEALAAHDILDLDQSFRLMRTQVDVVLDNGWAVLNANDAQVVEMAPLCDGEVLFYAESANTPALQAHRERGGRVAFIQDGRVVLAQGAQEFRLTELAPLPLLRGQNTAERREALLAAAGATWVLGLETELVAAGIETFDAVRLARHAA
ncbi:cyanophycin synthetase [Niveibacterium sp. SC-1]|uniref:cyanophycin synthetase n=1 Tax=Niveibacterium sp. SC-1 TaxID=3135646 RepID=UPI00311D7B1F